MRLRILLALCFIALFSACDKDENTDPAPDPTKYILEVEKQVKSTSGSIIKEPAMSIIYLWEAEDRNFDVGASKDDVIFGAVYDKTTDSFKTAKYGAVGSKMSEEIEPGKYFILVSLPKSSDNYSLAHSYTYFEIKEGETISGKKIFSHNVSPGQFEEWTKNK